MIKKVLILLLCFLVNTITFSQIIDHNCTTLEDIPAAWIDLARANLHIAYEHTSHGSQITSGMTGLCDWKGSSFEWNDGGTGGALDIDDYGITGGTDLGSPDFTSWAYSTRSYLDDPANSDVNVVMWSWCGELSYAGESDVNTYLDLMTGLENDYPDVKFVYMTGHLDGTGLTGNLHLRNEQIRTYCKANNKILYDFADIETYDPDGVYYGNMMPNDGCNYDYNNDGVTESIGDPSLPIGGDRNWAVDWQNSHTENTDWYDVYAEHTQALNANRKAYAAWWLWASLAGWESTTIETGEITGSEYCAGTGGTEVPFTCSPASFFTSSVFTAQLSDASGSFSSPVNMSSINSDGSETQSITVTIPAATVAGSGYRIRVTSDSPAVTGSDNGSDITVLLPGRWTGITSADWNDASNWSCGSVPVSGEVVIDDTENDPVIDAAVSCGDLTILYGGSLEIMPSGSLDIAGDLTVEGLLTIESDDTYSGSLFVSGGSLGNITYNRYMRSDDRQFFSSPVGGSIALFETDHNVEVYEWNEIFGIWDPSLSETEFIRGKGYAWDQNAAAPRTVAFTGSIVKSAGPVTATAPYSIPYYQERETWGGGGWNLLGNPFTSPMSAVDFIETNGAGMDPNYLALYIFDGPNKEYKWASATIPGYPFEGEFGPFVQAGQGFFVLAAQDDVQFNFTTDMQVYGPAVIMLKSAEEEKPWPGLQLKADYGEKSSTTLIVFNESMTAGLDPGYDVGLFSAGSDIEIYTTLTENDNEVKFARQALPLTDFGNYIIPLGLDTEKGGKVTFSAFVVPPGDYKFWLEDRITGAFTDLNTNTYTTNLATETYGTGRFFLYASETTPDGDIPLTQDAALLNIRVWTTHNRIIIEGALTERSIASVYDLHGNRILETVLNEGSYNTVTLPSAGEGVYVVKVTDSAKKYIQKIVIL